MSLRYIYFSSFILISLIPLFLVTGPFLADLSVVILNFFFFYVIFKEKKYSLFTNSFFLIFLIFCIYLVLRAYFTINLFVSIKSVLFYFRFLIFSLMVYLTLKNYNNFIRHFSIIFLITINFVLFDSIFQYFFGEDIFGIKSNHHTRISGPFGDELVLGSYLSRFSPFLIFLFYYSNKNLKYLSILTFAMGFFVTLLSAERTGAILYLITILFFVIYLKGYSKLKIMVLLFSLLSIVFILNTNNQKQRLFINSLQNIQNGEVWISVMHDAHIRTSLNMFLQNPVFGVGPKMFRYHCSEKRYEIKAPPNNKSNDLRCSTHPHNLLVQIMAETGIIGMFFYLTIFFYVIFQLIKDIIERFKSSNKSNLNFRIFFLYSFFLTLWPLAPSGNIFNNWLSIIFFYPLGFYLYFSKYKG